MKKILTTLCVLTLALLCVLALPAQADAETIKNGICGENLTWTLDSGSGVLEIKGKGEMKIDDMSVWSNYGSQVRHLVLSSEILIFLTVTLMVAF